MNELIQSSNLQQKQSRLKDLNKQLKKEFFGIDEVIDELIENFSSWYLFPQLQQRPLVINLWGMTGTGKTTLIKRIAEFLELDKLLYSFEMSKSNRYSLNDNLENISNQRNGQSMMILLDEFQHMRAYDEEYKMVENDRAQLIWQLIDSGHFELYHSKWLDYDAKRKIQKLNSALEAGVIVKNGMVIKGKSIFKKITNFDNDDLDNYQMGDDAYIKVRHGHRYRGKLSDENLEKLPIRFVSLELIEDICRTVDEVEYGMAYLLSQFEKLDGPATIRYIKDLIERALAVKSVDCSKAVIFVCGNLDRAYPMSRYLSPDIDADIFHDESKKINLADIKDCLSDFLRQEQISRLGNTHIIYPSLSSKAYKQLIVQNLNKLNERVMEQHQIRLIFDQNVRDLIYTEGVYPTQGTRPVLSTIRELIQSKLGEILGEKYLNNWTDLKEIRIQRKQETFCVTYLSAKEKLGEKHIPLKLKLDRMRSAYDGEKKVVVAVHESGHTLVHRILFNKSPRLVLSATASNQSAGLTLTDNEKLCSRSYAVKRLAVLMGGFCAEKQVFGVDAITSGSGGDLFSAEKMATKMCRDWGFQHFEDSRTFPGTTVRRQENGREVYQLLDEAMAVAADVLKQYEKALLKLSDTLIQKNCLHQEEIEALIGEFLPKAEEGDSAKKMELTAYQSQFERKLKSL